MTNNLSLTLFNGKSKLVTDCASNEDLYKKNRSQTKKETLLWMTHVYYSINAVKYLMSYFMQNRETIVHMPHLSGPLRPFRVYMNKGGKSITWFFNRINVDRYPTKIHAGAFEIDWNTFGELPPTKLEEVKDYRENIFNPQFKQARTNYDFILDIDGDHKAIKQGTSTIEQEFQKTKKWACILHEYFQQKKFPHYVNFSGGSGFQLRIPAKYLPHWKQVYPKADLIAEKIANQAGVPIDNKDTGGLDTTIYDHRRYFKVPYSISNGRVVLPVTTKELADFSLIDYDIVNVVRFMNLYNHFWKHGVMNEHNPKHIKAFISTLGE